MAISSLPTKEDRQKTKLDLASDDREQAGNTRFEYAVNAVVHHLIELEDGSVDVGMEQA